MSPAAESAPLLCQLRDDLGHRRIRSGIAALERLRPRIESLSPCSPQAGTLLGLIAQWVDAGFASPSLIVSLLDRFPTAVRGQMPLLDYLHLRMAEGVVEMSGENFDSAIGHFRFVQEFEREVDDAELL